MYIQRVKYSTAVRPTPLELTNKHIYNQIETMMKRHTNRDDTELRLPAIS